jgi:peptidoglycan/xylan/chitin deacetylase (PgdA/CDA1 family)
VSGGARRFTKRLVAQGLVRTGGWGAVLRTWARRDSTIVLTYHRVLDAWAPALDYSQPGMVVTAPTFERQLAFLQQHFEIVPLGALLDEGDTGRPRRRPRCVITFDDGWRDNYDLAFPLLRERGIPATIFLTTDFIGTTRVFWHTELIYLLLHGTLARFLDSELALASFPKTVRNALRRCVGRSRLACAADADTAVETIKTSCDDGMIRDLLDRLTRAADLRRPFLPERTFFLDWDQVREMAANGFEIGSHGCSHRIMTRISTHDARRELLQSKAEIESRVGRAVRHFAFPNEDANEALVGLVARAGYRTACVGGGAGEGRTGPGVRALRRVGMHEGAGAAGPAYEDALLGLCLLRAPKSRPA